MGSRVRKYARPDMHTNALLVVCIFAVLRVRSAETYRGSERKPVFEPENRGSS